MYKKIGVVGDKDSVLAFKAIGIDVFPVVEADEARICLLYTSPSPRDTR